MINNRLINTGTFKVLHCLYKNDKCNGSRISRYTGVTYTHVIGQIRNTLLKHELIKIEYEGREGLISLTKKGEEFAKIIDDLFNFLYREK